MSNKKKSVANSLLLSNHEAKLIFSSKAFKKMIFLVSACPKEVGWHGTVTKRGKGEYLIEDIILYPQKTTGVSISCDTAQYGLWQQNICIENPDYFESIRLHGHSHVNMRCFPSGVDKDLQDDGIEMIQEGGFYIYMIFNKRMESYVKIADREDELLYEHANIMFMDDDLSDLTADYKELVKGAHYGHE